VESRQDRFATSVGRSESESDLLSIFNEENTGRLIISQNHICDLHSEHRKPPEMDHLCAEQCTHHDATG
jgi:hypothetical protein